MSAQRRSSPPPATAAVVEFICLYTHDLRRKQKRWQDGRLKFHTFNKRVMVYDERGSFVGDTHWQHDHDLEEGEEIELSRGGVMVQVQELLHRTNQDLTELLDKRAKEKEQRHMQAVARSTSSSTVLARPSARPIPPDHFQLRHRPLHQVIGTPSGHHGRALVPKESPFEQRNSLAQAFDDRASKRRKFDDSPPSRTSHARALFGQALTLSATPMSSLQVRRQVASIPDSSAPIERPGDDAPREARQVARERIKSPQLPTQIYQQASKPDSRFSSSRDTVPSDNTNSKSRVAENLLRKRQLLESTTALEDDEVLEIMDPNVALTEPGRHARRADGSHNTRKAYEQPKKSISRNEPNRYMSHDVTKSNSDLLPKPISKALTRESGRSSNPGNTDPTGPKRNTTNITHETTGAGNTLGFGKAPEIEEPARATTELRLKSNRKRGLLIMSEAPKKARKRSAETTPVIALDNEDTHIAPDDDDHYYCPDWLPSDPQPSIPKSPAKSVNPIRRTISTELEKDENHVFCSSQPSAAHASPEPGADNPFGSQTLSTHDVDSLDRLDDDGNIDDGPETATGIDESLLKSQDQAPNNQTELQGLPQVASFDPCRIPSSSPDPNYHVSPWLATTIRKKATPEHEHSSPPSPSVLESPGSPEEVLEKNHGTKGRRNQRKRRKIVIDDDDDDESEKGMASGDDLRIPMDANSAALTSSEDTRTESPSGKESLRSTKRTTRQGHRGRALDSSQDDSNDDEPIVKPRKSKRAAAHMEIQDDSASARRKTGRNIASRRATRNRVVESDEASSSNEHDDADTEIVTTGGKKAYVGTKTQPRLTKIKNSVKSRELVGLDLAMLNARLGFREVGIPVARFSTVHEVANPSLGGLLPTITKHHDEIPPTKAFNASETIGEAEQRQVTPCLDRENPLVEIDAPDRSEFFSPDDLAHQVEQAASPTSAELNVATLASVAFGKDVDDVRTSGAGPAADIEVQARTSAPDEAHAQLTRPGHPSTTTEEKTVTKDAVEVDGVLPTDGTREISLSDRAVTLSNLSLDEEILPESTVESAVAVRTPAFQSPIASVQRTEEPPFLVTVEHSSVHITTTAQQQPTATKEVSSEQCTGADAVMRDALVNQRQASPDGLSSYQPINGTVPGKPGTGSFKDEPVSSDGPRPMSGLNAPLQRQGSVGLHRPTPAVQRINNLKAQLPHTRTFHEVSTETDSMSTNKPVARLANPASRGRKAALKSDAAGQVPQCVLPPAQPTVLIPISTADFAATPLEVPPPPAAREEEPKQAKKKMTFPGFQSARGEGPWSREAFDLLESGRPA